MSKIRPLKRKDIRKQPHQSPSLHQSNPRWGQPRIRQGRTRKHRLQPPLDQGLIPLLMEPRGRKGADRLPLSLRPEDRSLGPHEHHIIRARPPPNVRSRVAPVVVTTNLAGLIDLPKSVLLESHRQVIAVAGELRQVLLVDLLVMSVREGRVKKVMAWQPAIMERLQCIRVHPVVVKE